MAMAFCSLNAQLRYYLNMSDGIEQMFRGITAVDKGYAEEITAAVNAFEVTAQEFAIWLNSMDKNELKAVYYLRREDLLKLMRYYMQHCNYVDFCEAIQEALK